MFTIHPIFVKELYYFGLPNLPPLPGRVDFDDRGIVSADNQRPLFNVAFRLEGDLERWQATLSEVTHRFERSQTFRFEIRVPYSDEVAAAKAINGAVVLWDIDRDSELERIPVHVPRVVFLNQREVNNRWVLDHGGKSTMIGGQQTGPGGVPVFLPYPGMPLPAQVVLVGTEPGSVPRLEFPTSDDGADLAATLVINGLKMMLDQADAGPADAYPYTGVELNTFYLGQVFKRALLEAGGLPRDLCVTVPAGYNPEEVDHYKGVLGRAAACIGMPVPRIEVADEGTAGLVGVLQELLEELDGPAMEQILTGTGAFRCVGVDLGATTTDFSLARVEVVREDGRFVANLKLEAVAGLPVGGHAYTRLVMLCQLARLRCAADKSPPADVAALSEGHIEDIGDPYLVDLENPRTRQLLDALTEFLPRHQDQDVAGSRATRRVLFEVAEHLKTRLNTPLEGDPVGSYPEQVELDPATAEGWEWLCDYHNLPGMDETASFDADTLSRLFAPALQQLIDVVAGLCRVNRTPVQAICLTGNGSRLRALRSLTGNILLEGLTDDVFDRHPQRLFHAQEPKLAVAKGAFAVFHGAAQASNWEWRCSGLLDVLPYDLGRVTVANTFEVLVPRGTKLPHEMVPVNRPRELTLFKRAYPGDTPKVVGTLTFETARPVAEPTIKIDRERRIANQEGRPITPPPLRTSRMFAAQLSGLGGATYDSNQLYW
jgi:hypothetical protein